MGLKRALEAIYYENKVYGTTKKVSYCFWRLMTEFIANILFKESVLSSCKTLAIMCQILAVELARSCALFTNCIR